MSKWLVTLSIKNKEGRHDYFKDCYVDFEKKKPSLSELEKVKDSNRTFVCIDSKGWEHYCNPTIIFMQRLAED